MSLRNDRVESEITIAASPERIWEVLTKPEAIGTWFGTGKPMAIDLRPGGEMVLDHGANGTYRTVFVEVEAPRRLSFRWAEGYPGVLATDTSSTLVEFTITRLSERETLLSVAESGFAELVVPEGRQWISFESHSRGWPGMLTKAAAYLDGSDTSPLLASE
jgi:uncharacterized protein YndB with AHSA1/START domain